MFNKSISTIAVIQARCSSTRLPNKILKKIKDRTIIELIVERLSKSKLIDKIIVATTDTASDDKLCELLANINVEYFRGNEKNVLDRYYNAVLPYNPDNIVRITGDCPLIDPCIADAIIEELQTGNYDNVNNTYPPTFPDGLDVECFSFKALKYCWENALSEYDREHVTPYMHSCGKFRIKSYQNPIDHSSLRWTLDEEVDFILIENIYDHFYPNIYMDMKEVLKLVEAKPQLFYINDKLVRNQGSMLGTGQKLWKRAKNIIPGGNMLLSKRSEMFLPELWPSYYSKAKGCEVWDMDNNHFIDMSIMGIGTNTLGYGNQEVDEAVLNVVKSGNMCTLNCPEEVFLAEKLIELHPWAEMARFTRSGGEANAVALRIARAASGKDAVAICGYHGWHDWYLAANLGSDKSLNGHLLPGLEPNGVPQGLAGSIFTFEYNNIVELESLIKEKELGVIFMEVMRNYAPEDHFLHKVRKLATENNIVLIFDECTSGFRETYGGLHLKYGVEPDIAMFGKALGNGYAINAVIGRKNVMEAAQTTFISSTFWTERIGPAAAVRTLQVMKETKSWEVITEIGTRVSQKWSDFAQNAKLEISITGLPALTAFTFKNENALKYKTYVTQEMLKKGFLASNSFYSCTEHTDELLNQYFGELELVFDFIGKHQNDIDSFLESPVCHSGFKRLN